ncbi:MAG: UrcA family protein [Sphingopyxis sp.]|nr:UrcA family protein [Sphingopyxis sp.]
MTRKLTLFAAICATTVASAAPVLAQTTGAYEPTSRIVRYDDLDLNNERGRDRLNTRLRMAANSACGFWSAKSLTDRARANECRKAAIERVEPKVADAVRKAAQRYARAD